MRVAICQMNSGADVEANVDEAELLLAEAADAGADLAALPELFHYMGPPRLRAELAEPVPGPVSERMSAMARERSMWVLAGSVLEAEGGKVFNTSVLLDRSGEVVARYRKIHLFDAEPPGQPPIRESDTLVAGEQLVTHETEFARVGLSICYDLRFPELYRGLMALGAEVITVPSQFQWATGIDHWEILLRARAIENQCFIVAPAQWGPYGKPEDNRRSYGNSMIVDPWGRVLVRAPQESTAVVFADLDFEELRDIRRKLPAISNRRLGFNC